MGEHSSVLKTLMTVMTSGQDGKRKALQPLTLKNRGDCGCCGWMSTTLWKIRPFLLADFKGEEEVLKLCGLIISALHRAQGTGHRAQGASTAQGTTGQQEVRDEVETRRE